MDADTLHSVMVFFFLYIAFLMVGTLMVSLDGVDFTTSFSATAACCPTSAPGPWWGR